MTVNHFGKLQEILDSVKDRIVSQLTDATADNVIVSDDPNVRPMVAGEKWYVVCPSPQEQADLQSQNGGGQDQLSIRTRIIVTVNIAATTDQPDRINATYATLRVERKLVIRYLTYNSTDDWFPTGANEPLIYAEGSYAKTEQHSSFQMAFDVEYDEDFA